MPAAPTPMISIIVNRNTPGQRVFATVPVHTIEDFGARQVAAAFTRETTETVHYFGPWTPMDHAGNKTVEWTALERTDFVDTDANEEEVA